MNRKFVIYIVLTIFVGVCIGVYFYNKSPIVSDYRKAEFVIEGQRVKIDDKDYFGNELYTDLNNDGREDVVFLITQQPGGSGTFYYVVSALNTEQGYVGSDAILLGDRIAPQTTEISQNPAHQNVIVVNYADRASGEPMTVQPSVGKSIWLKLDPQSMQFGEVVQNFEGEADPNRMNLNMKTWEWVRAQYNDGKELSPKKPGIFTLTFKTDGTFSARTDCNGVGGSYTATKSTVTLNKMMSTLMYCGDSQEADFTKLLGELQGYFFTSKGELVFDLKFDSGTMTFR